MAWDAIILAGGRARRLGGTAKPDVMIGAASLLERTVTAVQNAERIIIAGDASVDGCITVHEPEPFGGPVAGLAAALPHATADQVLVVACDHPFLERAIPTLVDAADGSGGVIAVDHEGVRQNLLVCVGRAVLSGAMADLGSPIDASMRQLLSHLDLREIVVDERAVVDVDTWDDVAAARELERMDFEVVGDD